MGDRPEDPILQKNKKKKKEYVVMSINYENSHYIVLSILLLILSVNSRYRL
jgi:hypothetical protein